MIPGLSVIDVTVALILASVYYAASIVFLCVVCVCLIKLIRSVESIKILVPGESQPQESVESLFQRFRNGMRPHLTSDPQVGVMTEEDILAKEEARKERMKIKKALGESEEEETAVG